MSIHEDLDAKQAGQNSRLEAVIAAAVAGTHLTVPPTTTATAPLRSTSASPAVASIVARTMQAPDLVLSPEPGLIAGGGWDEAIAKVNSGIIAQGGVLPRHMRDSGKIAPQRESATIGDRHGCAGAADRPHTGGASSWDDAVARVNAENGVSEPLMRKDQP